MDFDSYLYFIMFYLFPFYFQQIIDHLVLKDVLDPIRKLDEDVRRKALMRLQYEGLDKAEAITTPGARFHGDPAGFAMERYAYYVCFKCKKVRFGVMLHAYIIQNSRPIYHTDNAHI